jgi:Kazal-type serine protease inhibitor-like protein
MATRGSKTQVAGLAAGRRVAWLIAAALCGCGDAPAPRAAGAACSDNAECGADQRCDWAPPHACGADQAAGTCVAFERGFCPALAYPVCGCDGGSYTNECFSSDQAVAVAYGGPCRTAGIYTACNRSADCPKGDDSEQACVDDPRDACVPGGATPCPGICVHAAYECGEALPCASAVSASEAESPGTEACVAVIDCTGGDCLPGRCVYTTRATCTSAAACDPGELCLPAVGCAAGACPGVCVRP